MHQMYSPASVVRLQLNWVVSLVHKPAGSTKALCYGCARMAWHMCSLALTCIPV